MYDLKYDLIIMSGQSEISLTSSSVKKYSNELPYRQNDRQTFYHLSNSFPSTRINKFKWGNS